jgi:type II secretory pathway component PulF
MNNIFTRLTPKEQTMFAKRLSFLIRAGVPILESLRLLRHSRSKSKTKIFDQIIKDVENGQSLAAGLEKFKFIFGDFAINIVRVGESAGILDQNLNYLAEELKKGQELRRKVLGSLVYPCFIVVATFGIVVLLLTFVFPKILPIFSSMNVSLPWPTKATIFLSGLAIHYGLYFLAVFFLLAVIFWLLVKKTEMFRLAIHRLILRLPLIGRMVQSYQLTNFFRTFGLLLKSGVTVSAAIKILVDSVPNLVYKREFQKLTKNMAKGKKISSELEAKPHLFPEIAVQMIATGEYSGNLSETMLYLAEMYENEVEELTKNLSVAIEPSLMIFMGLLVGFVAISIIMPIYQITQNLKV